MNHMDIDWNEVSWRKSGKSGGGNCVEIARLGDKIAVRNSRFPDGERLIFTVAEFRVCVDDIKSGGLSEFAQ